MRPVALHASSGSASRGKGWENPCELGAVWDLDSVNFARMRRELTVQDEPGSLIIGMRLMLREEDEV